MQIHKNSYFKLLIRCYILILIGLNSPATAGIGVCDNFFSELRVELDLPILVVNTLRKKGINTVKKLASKTKEELLNLPYFSTEYLREVEIALAKKDLTLKNASSKVSSKKNLHLNNANNSISSLDLSNKAKSALLAEGIKTVEMLSSKTEQELLRIPNFGKVHDNLSGLFLNIFNNNI
ncbi:MAG: helix-hairpin-helix domain-containing protein, partial [Oligoflexia bacterium]|nr:helix-hairpin-helix domain-containing protein [Oligoflexia bacterium]